MQWTSLYSLSMCILWHLAISVSNPHRKGTESLPAAQVGYVQSIHYPASAIGRNPLAMGERHTLQMLNLLNLLGLLCFLWIKHCFYQSYVLTHPWQLWTCRRGSGPRKCTTSWWLMLYSSIFSLGLGNRSFCSTKCLMGNQCFVPKSRNKPEMSPLTISIQHCTGILSQTIRQGRDIKATRERNRKICVFTESVIVHIENPKERLLEPVR